MTHYTSMYSYWNRLLLLAVLLTSFLSNTAQAPVAQATNQIWYVNYAADSLENGQSWDTAFKNLQSALSVAQATDQIWVAQGIYYPTNVASERTATFRLKNGVALYGGFAGDEDELEERDWQTNLTILSGDIDKNDLHVSGVVTSTTGIIGTNSYHVVTDDTVDGSALLDGFVITAGRANGSNEKEHGGALYISRSSPTINNVSFSGNNAINGGAIYSETHSNPSITNSSFSGNSATNGGAIYSIDSNHTIANAIFSGNNATNGGALYSYLEKITITNSNFSGNHATNGGAIYSTNSDHTITNSIFSGNSATNTGGAIQNRVQVSHRTGILRIINTTISGNNAINKSGAIFSNYGSFSIFNSILWGNSSSITVENLPSFPLPSNIIYHSLVQGCVAGWEYSTECGHDFAGNLANVDPLFVNPMSYLDAPTTNGDFHLQSRSPAIDVGNNALNSTITDLAGEQRIVGPRIDLGAYESSPQVRTNVIGNGHIDYTPQLEWYKFSETVAFSATAKPGWSFAGWSGDLSGNSPYASIVLSNTRIISATFTNDPPTADAGADQMVRTDTLVTLDGSASFDADPDQTLTYGWTQIDGSDVILSNTNVISPTFTPIISGTLIFSLVVTDSLGLASTAHNVTITVTNGEPVAHASEDQLVFASTLVTLDGSGSSDPDGHTPLTYAWVQTAGTPMALAGANTAQPTFTAPSVTGTLTFGLVVTDSLGLVSTADSVTITVISNRLFLPLTLQ